MHWLTASINIIVNWRGVGSRIKGSITEIITIDWTGSLKSSRSTYLWGHWSNSYVAENIDTTLVHWSNNSKISPNPPNLNSLFVHLKYWLHHFGKTMQPQPYNQQTWTRLLYHHLNLNELCSQHSFVSLFIYFNGLVTTHFPK